MQKTQVPYLAVLSSVFFVVKVNQLGAFNQHLILKEKALASSISGKKKKNTPPDIPEDTS